MSRVVLRPATRADFDKLTSEPLPCRVKAWAAERDGEVLGVGGLAFLPTGTVAAFVHAAPGAHRYKMAFHKAGLMAMAEAKRMGLKHVVAMSDKSIEPASRWLERLGFRPMMIDGEKVYTWQC